MEEKEDSDNKQFKEFITNLKKKETMKLQWLIVACCAMSFAACNNEEIISDQPEQPETDNTVPDYVEGLEFRDLVTMEAIETEEGSSTNQNSNQGIGGSRAPENVTENGRPKGVYPLDYLYFVVTNPTQQPTQGGSIADLNPTLSSCTEFPVNGEFSLQFAEDPENIKDENGVYSDQGKIWIKLPNKETVSINLSVAEKELVGDKQIPLNNLAFDYTDTPRGSSIYYTSYNVNLPELTSEAKASWLTYSFSDNETAYNLWYDMRASYSSGFTDPVGTPQMHVEFGDKLFVGNELMAFAKDGNIYVYEVTANGLHSGYNLQYAFSTGDALHKTSISMKRLTATVNASFTFTGDYANNATTETPVKELFDKLEASIGFDLEGMDCPYATIDGLSLYYNPNTGETSENRGRVLLWDYDSENGQWRTHCNCKPANVSYALNNGQGSAIGVGILGNAHAFVFPTSDLSGYVLSFWVNLPEKYNAWIRIDAQFPNGIGLDQNANTQLVALVPSKAGKYDGIEITRGLKEVLEEAAENQTLTRSGAKKIYTMKVPGIIK